MNSIVIRRKKQVSINNTPFTRENLRNLARLMGVKRGRNTNDTIRNLKAAGIPFTNS